MLININNTAEEPRIKTESHHQNNQKTFTSGLRKFLTFMIELHVTILKHTFMGNSYISELMELRHFLIARLSIGKRHQNKEKLFMSRLRHFLIASHSLHWDPNINTNHTCVVLSSVERESQKMEMLCSERTRAQNGGQCPLDLRSGVGSNCFTKVFKSVTHRTGASRAVSMHTIFV